MRRLCRIACMLVLTCGALLPITLWGQSQESSSTIPAPGLNEQQKAGEALFLQNCPLCHIYSDQKKRLGIPTASLKGLFKKPVSEDVVRQLILQGIPRKMPGFQYGLEPKEVDAIMAYL